MSLNDELLSVALLKSRRFPETVSAIDAIGGSCGNADRKTCVTHTCSPSATASHSSAPHSVHEFECIGELRRERQPQEVFKEHEELHRQFREPSKAPANASGGKNDARCAALQSRGCPDKKDRVEVLIDRLRPRK
jgi:hypothetical protein